MALPDAVADPDGACVVDALGVGLALDGRRELARDGVRDAPLLVSCCPEDPPGASNVEAGRVCLLAVGADASSGEHAKAASAKPSPGVSTFLAGMDAVAGEPVRMLGDERGPTEDVPRWGGCAPGHR